MSLLVHPDRVPEDEKELATEKFKVLSKINSVLTDKEKKSLYDESGVIDDDDEDESSMSKWMEMWKAFFKPITTQDIDNYQKEYVGKFYSLEVKFSIIFLNFSLKQDLILKKVILKRLI